MIPVGISRYRSTMAELPSQLPARWRAGPSGDLAWAELDGDFVVYHRPSGKTHFLNPATASLLQDVLTQWCSAPEAAAALADRQGAAVDDVFSKGVAEALLRLEYAGLVERRNA
jgi:PqqD family protein of HPr-rel-A system